MSHKKKLMQGLEKQIEREKSEKKRKKREWWEHHFYHGVVRCGHFQRTGESLYNFKFVCWIGDWFSSFLSCYSKKWILYFIWSKKLWESEDVQW